MTFLAFALPFMLLMGMRYDGAPRLGPTTAFRLKILRRRTDSAEDVGSSAFLALEPWAADDILSDNFVDNLRAPSTIDVLQDFYTAPATKFVVRTITFFAFIIHYAAVLFYAKVSCTVTVVESLFYAWALVFGIEELGQLISAWSAGVRHFRDFWNVLDAYVFWVALPIAMCVRLASRVQCCAATSYAALRACEPAYEEQPELALVARALLALAAVPCFVRALAIFRVRPQLGLFLHLLRKVLADTQAFVLVLCWVLLGFAFTFEALAKPASDDDEPIEDSPGAKWFVPAMLPVWNLFDLQGVDTASKSILSSVRRGASPRARALARWGVGA